MGIRPDKPEEWSLERTTDLVLDFTGTLSKDGFLLPGVAEKPVRLSKRLRLSVLTADTFGTAGTQLKGLPIEMRIVAKGSEKADFVRRIGGERVVAIGNGRKYVPMMRSRQPRHRGDRAGGSRCRASAYGRHCGSRCQRCS